MSTLSAPVLCHFSVLHIVILFALRQCQCPTTENYVLRLPRASLYWKLFWRHGIRQSWAALEMFCLITCKFSSTLNISLVRIVIKTINQLSAAVVFSNPEDDFQASSVQFDTVASVRLGTCSFLSSNKTVIIFYFTIEKVYFSSICTI